MLIALIFMPTIQQLIRSKRRPKVVHSKSPALEGNPQAKGVCISVTQVTPKKPNSSMKSIAKVRLVRTGRVVIAYIIGEGHNLSEHSTVIIRGGRVPDLVGVRYKVIRGALDTDGVNGRKQGRSLYGTKKQKK